MISHERGLYVIAGGITFTRLFENVQVYFSSLLEFSGYIIHITT